MLKTRIGELDVWRRTTGAILLISLFLIVFGVLPAESLFWSHCRIAEFAVVSFVILKLIRNFWLKAFLFWNLINQIIVALTYPQQAGAGAFISFYYIFLFAVFFETVYRNIKKEHINFIVNGMCVVAVLQMVYMILQHFRIDPFLEGIIDSVAYQNMDVKDLVVGTWGHTNFSAAYIAASIPLFFRKKWNLFLPFLFTVLFWCRSWGAMIALCIGIIVYAMFALPRKLRIGLIILIVLSSVIYGTVFEKRQFNPFESDRMQYVKPAIELIKVKPVVGWGLGQFKSTFFGVNREIFKGKVKKTHAHFEIIEHVTETGLPVLIPIFGFLLSTFIIFLRKNSLLSILAFSGATVILVNSCSSFILRSPIAWILMMYLIIILKTGEKDVN